MKSIRIICNASCYFVIFRFFIWITLLFNRSLSESINYHYSDDLTWYLIWLIAPALLSILTVKRLQLIFFQKVGIALLPLVIVGTMIGGYKNYAYWGYPFKRPTVFKELKKASTIISITDIEKAADAPYFSAYTDTSLTKHLVDREDLYYGILDRPIMTFLDKANTHNNLENWYEISKDVEKKASQQKLRAITNSVVRANLFIKPKKRYEERGNRFSGRIIEFQTVCGEVFYHMTLNSGEVANDHYPTYEILMSESDTKLEILKSQYFYTDFAGIEGFEYCNTASLIEFVVFMCLAFLVWIIYLIMVLLKRKRLWS